MEKFLAVISNHIPKSFPIRHSHQMQGSFYSREGQKYSPLSTDQSGTVQNSATSEFYITCRKVPTEVKMSFKPQFGILSGLCKCYPSIQQHVTKTHIFVFIIHDILFCVSSVATKGFFVLKVAISFQG